MEEEFQEYVTFTVTDKEGKEVEMAVVDEFEFEHKIYVVGAVIEDDMINEDGLYIYKAKVNGEELAVEKITNQINYEKIAKAYMELEEN